MQDAPQTMFSCAPVVEQRVLADAVMATTAQTAEVCSCGVPVTELQGSRCPDTSVKYNGQISIEAHWLKKIL